MMQRMRNRQLAASGLNAAVEQVEFFTIGNGRRPPRIHKAGLRFVANDCVDSRTATSSGTHEIEQQSTTSG